MSQPNLPSHWKLIPLGELSNIQSGGTPWREKPEFYGGQIKWVKTLDLNEGIVTQTEETINELGFQSIRGKLRPANTVMVAMYGGAGTVGKSGVLGVPATTNQAVCCIEPNLDKFDSFYLLYHLIYLRPTWMREAIGTRKDPNISKGIIENTKIPLPPLPEQRAIAHTLRTIQKAKEARQRELELERERKAALTQHFFTHGTRGEALKQTELGFIPDSWIVSRFDSFCILQRGFDITKKEQEPGEYPVISSSGISSYHNSHKVKGPGVIIGRKGTLGTVHYVDCDYWPHDTTLWVKEFKGNHPRFTAYFLASLNLKRFDCGASNPTLNRNTVHVMTIAYPQKEEQQEIAVLLNACDRKITALEQEAAFLDELFRAMLEELMTGRLSALPLVEEKAIA